MSFEIVNPKNLKSQTLNPNFWKNQKIDKKPKSWQKNQQKMQNLDEIFEFLNPKA